MNLFNTLVLYALSFAATFAALPAAQAGEVKVSFVEPEKFADIGRAPWERDGAMRGLERHFQALAQKYIPVDQQLVVEVTDVDLAGEQNRSVRHPELRVVRRIDWPSMTLRYTLKSGETVVSQGQERLSDMGFDDRIGVYSSVESYVYEKRMLEDWFKARFAKSLAKSAP